MPLSKVNASAATLTKNRTEDSISPSSGMCATCIDGCIGMCEIGKSAYRGAEVIYPQPFGMITTAATKDYPVDLSHFTIQGTVKGAQGIETDSDRMIFPNVDLERQLGGKGGIRLRLPIVISALGSTAIAKNNWAGLAVGAAISGIPLTVGENVCGMDPKAEFSDGRLVHSPELAERVKLFKDWQRDGYGEIIVQANVEDTRMGVQEYAISELGVTAVEMKWGQGAKDIGGEVRVDSLEKAQLLKSRGYLVLPDPASPPIIDAFRHRSFREFERHSRVGVVSEDSFIDRVKTLRKAGAKYVSLKTGAYRPADLARALKFSSLAKINVLSADAAGGGTGMSPWRMMNEWGVPGVYFWSLLYRYADRLADKGEYVPDIIVGGGLTLEDHIFKALALGAPYFKAVGMARAPLAAAMVGKTIGKRLREGQPPVYVGRFGTTPEEVFVTAPELRQRFKDFEDIPTGAMGVYTYLQRLSQGTRQLMSGSRKFNLDSITRDDIAALTTEAAKVSGVKYVMDADREEADKILDA